MTMPTLSVPRLVVMQPAQAEIEVVCWIKPSQDHDLIWVVYADVDDDDDADVEDSFEKEFGAFVDQHEAGDTAKSILSFLEVTAATIPV